jgi:hypothetical protein
VFSGLKIGGNAKPKVEAKRKAWFAAKLGGSESKLNGNNIFFV